MIHPIRVLLIEDSDYDAALVLLELREGGYEPLCERVETAAAMAAALDRQSWDVVIADYVLPRFSGPGALKLLQERGLDLPFIIVSGHIDEDTAVASMKAGAHDYVMKDRLARLVPAIERELQEAEVRRARRQSEKEFAREQAFRHTIEESIPSGIAAVDSEGRHTYVNPAFCQMVGWSEAELLGTRPPYAYWPPEGAASIRESLSKVTQGQISADGFELRFRHRNGKLFDVRVLINPIKDAHGQETGWLGSVTDITKRKRAERRLQVQYAVARVLSQAADLRIATPQILAAVGKKMGWEAGALWRVKPGTAELDRIGTWQADPVNAGEFQKAGELGNELPDRVLATGQPVWLSPSGLGIADSLHGACGFPIRLGDDVLGIIGFFSHENLEPDDTLEQWMVSIGNQIGQFMERAMAEEGLRRAHDELEQRVQERTADLMDANARLEYAIQERRRLENELLEITEKERRRIGLDLHDDLGQKLAGLTLMMKGLELGLEKKKLPEAVEARRIQALIEQTVHHAGDLARDLALADLGEEDLPSALKALASHVRGLFAISCRFKSEGFIPSLDKNVIRQFYKITQEAVTNAVKHGKARQVGINLAGSSGHLVLTIRNNGLPFPSMIDQSKGMGLRIMNYRANVIGATLEIKPICPKGTLVICTLSFRPNPARNSDNLRPCLV